VKRNFVLRCVHIIFIIGCLLLVVSTGCVGRKKPDDIVLIKNLLEDFSYGLNQKNVSLLDSLFSGNKEERGSALKELMEDFSNLGEVKNLGLLGRRIELFGNDATVNLTLKGERMTEGKTVEFRVPLELKLVKKREVWRIVGHKFL
jgi:hypothetical protein